MHPTLYPRRFVPAVLLGGGVSGFLIALPVLGDILRCLFGAGVLAGAALSMKLWLDTHLAENLSPVEALYVGGLSGVTTAIVAWVVSVPIRLGFGESLGDFYMGQTFLPDSLRYLLRALYANDFVDILTSLVFQVVVFGGLGALGGFLALQFTFAGRRAV